MELDEGQKAMMVILCIVIAVGSVFGLLAGIVLAAFTGERGYIALIVISALAFVGAIFGIFYILIGKKTEAEKSKERKKRTTKETLVWAGVTILTGTGAFLFLFFGIRWMRLNIDRIIASVAVFSAAFLFSLFMLLSGRSIRKKYRVDTRTSSE